MNYTDMFPLQYFFVVELNDWSISAVPPLHVEAHRIVIAFVRKAELKKTHSCVTWEEAFVGKNLFGQLVEKLVPSVCK